MMHLFGTRWTTHFSSFNPFHVRVHVSLSLSPESKKKDNNGHREQEQQQKHGEDERVNETEEKRAANTFSLFHHFQTAGKMNVGSRNEKEVERGKKRNVQLPLKMFITFTLCKNLQLLLASSRFPFHFAVDSYY